MWCSPLSSPRTVGVGGGIWLFFLCKLSDRALGNGTLVILGAVDINSTPSSYRLIH